MQNQQVQKRNTHTPTKKCLKGFQSFKCVLTREKKNCRSHKIQLITLQYFLQVWPLYSIFSYQSATVVISQDAKKSLLRMIGKYSFTHPVTTP